MGTSQPKFQIALVAQPATEKRTSPDLPQEILQEMQELKNLVKECVKTESTPNCCTDYTFVPTYDRCADCHYSSWYKPRLNETTSKIKCNRIDNKYLKNNERDACGIFEHHDRLVEEIRCTDCRYVMRVDGRKNQKAELDPDSCKCSVKRGEVLRSPFRDDEGIIELKDSRGNPVSAGDGRDWTSIPKF